ncbi:hypothetical protein WA026_003122 [Henosepilachna vigintioctopunctata]|uniref:Peptidase S1 domain-containing protein n=1 Tax=Henosepilachna vigintioctopunctata TaxID=420089 RepID=A0AAW1TII0_9CUCU
MKVSTICIVLAYVSTVCSFATIGKSITSSSNNETTSLSTHHSAQNYLEDMKNEPQWRIVGGDDCHHTFMVDVVLAQTGAHVCSGTLISPHFVLSAATCYLNFTDPPPLHAVLGRSNYRESHSIIGIKWVQPAPKFLSEYRTVLPHQGEVSFIKLPSISYPDDLSDYCPSNLFTAAGWGNTNPNSINTADLSPKLKCANIPYLTNEKCSEKIERFNPDFYMCISDPRAKVGICHGDIGGPVFCDGIQYGIITDVKYCTDPLNPTFVVRVDRQMAEFISRFLKYFRSCSSSVFGKLLYFTMSLMTIVLTVFLN